MAASIPPFFHAMGLLDHTETAMKIFACICISNVSDEVNPYRMPAPLPQLSHTASVPGLPRTALNQRPMQRRRRPCPPLPVVHLSRPLRPLSAPLFPVLPLPPPASPVNAGTSGTAIAIRMMPVPMPVEKVIKTEKTAAGSNKPAATGKALRRMNMIHSAVSIGIGIASISDKLKFAAANGRIDSLHEMLGLGLFSPASLSDALFHAVTGRHVAAIEVLLFHGANVHACHEGQTLLSRMIEDVATIDDLDVLTVLLEHIDFKSENTAPDRPELRRQSGTLPCSDAELDLISRLLHSTDIEDVPGDDIATSALHHGLQSGEFSLTPGIINGLVYIGADLNLRLGEDQVSALMLAAQVNLPDTVRLMIQLGADVHLADALGNTALHAAAFNLNVDAVRILVKAGALHDEPNQEGATAQSLYKIARQLECQSRSDFRQAAENLLFGIRPLREEDPLHVSWEPADCDSYRELPMPQEEIERGRISSLLERGGLK